MRLALDQLDAMVDQVAVEVLVLLLGELDFFERVSDLVVVEQALDQALLDELGDFLDLWELDLDRREHLASTFSRDRLVTDCERLSWLPLGAGWYRRVRANRTQFLMLVCIVRRQADRLFRTAPGK